MVDVVQERVQGLGPLADALVQPLPLHPAEHPRQQIERDQALGVAPLAVDGEGDADAPEDGLGLLHAPLQPRDAGGLDPALDFRVALADGAVLVMHLVEGHGEPG